MFGIGWSELAVILCVAIIFIQPRDLPKLFRKLGKLYGQVKKAYAEITATKDQFVKDIEAAAVLEEEKEKASSGGDAAIAPASVSSSGSAATPEPEPQNVGKPEETNARAAISAEQTPSDPDTSSPPEAGPID
jgi:sec-independent protein translocase protein TatB